MLLCINSTNPIAEVNTEILISKGHGLGETEWKAL